MLSKVTHESFPGRLLLIFNHRAANGRAQKSLTAILNHFEEKQIAVETKLTEYRLHAREIAAKVDFSRFDGLIVAGGDGTVFEVINGYMRNQSTKRIPIGILPIGTGNAFAKDFGLESGQWRQAIDMISRNRPIKIDVGKFRTEGQDSYFLNILGIGFVTDVMATSVGLKFLGNIAYLLSVFYQLLFLRTYSFTLTIDGKTIKRDAVMVEISNTRYTGRNFLMAPGAKYDDGFFDVLVLGKASRLRLLRLFPSLFKGEHLSAREIETFRAKTIRVETATARRLGPDGELFGSTPVQVECLHLAVAMFA